MSQQEDSQKEMQMGQGQVPRLVVCAVAQKKMMKKGFVKDETSSADRMQAVQIKNQEQGFSQMPHDHNWEFGWFANRNWMPTSSVKFVLVCMSHNWRVFVVSWVELIFCTGFVIFQF